MFKWTVALFDRIFSVGGAVVFSQIPQFMQQYSQRLSGHISELDHQVGLMRNAAEASGLSLQEYIQKFLLATNEQIFTRQGSIMQQLVDRFRDLSQGLKSIQEASIYERPLVFVSHFNSDIARETWDSFNPGVPTTLEGLAYALVGMLLGIIVFYSLKKLLAVFFRKLTGKEKKVLKPSPSSR